MIRHYSVQLIPMKLLLLMKLVVMSETHVTNTHTTLICIHSFIHIMVVLRDSLITEYYIGDE